MKWISVHIFFTSSVDKFLVDCLSPTVKKLEEKGLISCFFFILYNEGGPHVRFRFKTSSNKSSLIVVDEMDAYLKSNPSPVDLTRDSTFFPNDSIHFIPYLPELDRYGGKKAMDVVEKQFQNSSEVILKFLLNENTTEITYYKKMTAIIILHVTTCFAYCDGNLERAIMFFSYLFNGLRGNYPSRLLKKNFSIELNYRDYYLNQRSNLAAFINNVWEGTKNNELFDFSFDNLEWLNREREFVFALEDLHVSNNVQTFHLFENYPLWSVFQSHIHMTNNRMGIPPHEEALIAYYIMRGLKEITNLKV